MTKPFWRKSSALAALFLTAVTLACGDGDLRPRDGNLLDEPKVDRTAEQERVRQMQLLRVLDAQDNEETFEIESSEFEGILKTTCSQSACLYQDCWPWLCKADEYFCIARVLQGMAETPAAIQLKGDWTGPDTQETFTVPPQSNATNAKLATASLYWYQVALASTIGAVKGHADCRDTAKLAEVKSFLRETTVSGPRPDMTAASLIATLMGGALQNGREAYQLAVKSLLAVSDAEMSSSPSDEVGKIRSISGAMSRTAAAHALVGGPPGFQGSDSEAFCTSGKLTGPTKTALAVLREAALPPTDLRNVNLTTQKLLNAPHSSSPGSTDPSDGSVKSRLGELWGTTLAANQDVEILYGLEVSDFEAARRALVEEMDVFERSTTAKLTPFLPGGATATYDRYAGTSGKAPERPAAYWHALLQMEEPDESEVTTNEPWRNSSPLPNTGPFGFDSTKTAYVKFLDYAHTGAAYMLSLSALRTTGTTSSQNRVQADLLGPLQLFTSAKDSPRRLTHCYDPGTSAATAEHTFIAYGFAASDGLRVVSGEDALQCAIDGTVEGAECAMTATTGTKLDATPSFFDPPYTTAAKGTLAGTSAQLGKRSYLIRPKLQGNVNAGPGEWEAVYGFPLFKHEYSRDPSPYFGKCRDLPIVPDAIVQAAQIMAPSRDWCGTQEMSCVGKRFDERLPLEDELTNDGDGVESSWKHYIGLARQAANESDLLGEEYVSRALDLDSRLEEVDLRRIAQEEKAAGVLDNLQNICGTAVDPAPLLRALGQNSQGDFDLSAIDQGACTEGEALAPGLVCRSGRKVKDWLNIAAGDPELKDLAECVATFTTTTTAHLGDKDICMWKDTNGEMCKETNPPSGLRCPDVAPLNGGCKIPTGMTEIKIPAKPNGLAFFSTNDTLPPPPVPSMCATIRRLRAAPNASDAELAKIVAANTFNSSYLANYRQRIQFEATYGSFANINVDDKLFATTGNGAQDYNGNSWPCSPNGRAADCATGGAGLFCDSYDCSTPAARQVVNERLFNAVTAAQATTHVAGKPEAPPSWLPLYLRSNAIPLDGALTNPSVFGIPLDRYSNDRWRMFEGNVQAGHAALLAHNMRMDWPLAPPGAYAKFTLGAFGLRDVPNLLNQYWGGMSQDGSGSKGYIYTALTSGTVGLTNPGTGRAINFGSDQFIDRSCSASCIIWPPCVCAENTDNKQREDLKGHALASHDPANGMIIDVLPINYTYPDQSILDGFELLCEVVEGVEDRQTACGGSPPQLKKVDDLGRMGTYLTCVADDIARHVALQTFNDFPMSALDPLNQSGARGNLPLNGRMGEAVSMLRSALAQVAASGPNIARTIRLFGEDMKQLRETVALYDIDNQIADIEFASAAAQQVANCLHAVVSDTTRISGDNLVSAGAKGAALAAITCVNAAAQIGFANSLRNLKHEQSQGQRELAISDFNSRFITHTTGLDAEAIALADAVETVYRQLGVIDDLRQEAKRAVDTALWHLSTQARNQAEITKVLGARSETARVRYVRAHENAKRMAFLARRAIEQRLGISMDEMTEDLPLVDPPATWAPTVCTTTGIDYTKLRDGAVTSYADTFIGDYVTKLENVVESYRLTQNFHEGADTAVVSLRDDIHNLRANCDQESPNRLFYASALDRATNQAPPIPPDPDNDFDVEFAAPHVGWVFRGCAKDATGNFLKDCLAITPHTQAPFVSINPRFRAVRGFKLKIGDGATCPAETCGYRDGAYMGQDVELEPGRYRLSWYSPDGSGSASANAGFVSINGTEATLTNGTPIPATMTTWARYYRLFTVTSEGVTEESPTKTVTIGFRRPAMSAATELNLAAPMLDRVDNLADQQSSLEPKLFSDTLDTRTISIPVCQDTDGRVFREKAWRRHCVQICPDGYSSDCRGRGRESCYWETSFHISQRGIEAGQIFNQSGFARGNFNYRMDKIALNFVGTGLRECSESETPNACYSGAFIPYSLVHGGPYFVRNHKGTDFEARLFTGRIEHARGLAAERYLSNPMGDADRTLLADYERSELQGRPLDGEYTVQVWEEEAVDFHAIEDVQLIIDYRYWTRFD